MPDTIVQVENLGKKYIIGHQKQERYTALRDVIARGSTSFARRLLLINNKPLPNYSKEEFWALKEVSFEVKPGELVGIIGRNGAGKSTLLKILSRITEPTIGSITLRGRVASLLEVGTGFHPELTGRENIYLNGAILGMHRAEIKKKFDEIIDFAEVEKFLDTPVKRYSSGMYVRLAFAVAAHLEPEILIVDEVLAVGDAKFQRKCLNKMQQVGQNGRTVLFVSHNMPAVTRLCSRAIHLNDGKIINDGLVNKVVSDYLHSGLGTMALRRWDKLEKAPGNQIARLIQVRICDKEGQTVETIDIRQPVGIEMEYQVLSPGHVLVPNYHFFNEEGIYLFVSQDLDPVWKGRTKPRGRYKSIVWIPGNFLTEGSLIVGAALSTMETVEVHFYERDAVAFQVVDNLEGSSVRGDYAGDFPGVIRPMLNWETVLLNSSDFTMEPVL